MTTLTQESDSNRCIIHLPHRVANHLLTIKSQQLLQVQGNTLLVANAGDSRCVVSEAGKAVPMSFDHKPTDEKEHSRIIKVSSFCSVALTHVLTHSLTRSLMQSLTHPLWPASRSWLLDEGKSTASHGYLLCHQSSRR